MEIPIYQMNKKILFGFIVLGALVVNLVIISLITGNYSAMTPLDSFRALVSVVTGRDFGLPKTIVGIMTNIRIPRTIASLLIGGTLAAAGCSFQELFRNSLASPDVLGVSSGACTGAALGIVLGAGTLMIHMLSFLSGIAALVLVFVLSRIFKGSATSNLLISGMLISGMMNSLLGLLKYIADQETQLPAIVYWTMGSVSSIESKQLISVALPVLISLSALFVVRWRMNFFAVNKNEAASMGVNLRLLRVIVVIAATLLVSSVVSIAGSISWIGLVIPHLIKTIFGNNTRWSFPLSVLAGSSFLCGVDILNRLISTSEVPVSILTGLTGIPIFIVCIFCSKKVRRVSNAKS